MFPCHPDLTSLTPGQRTEDRGRACKEDHPSPLKVSAGSGLWLECQYSQLQGVREMGIALDRKLNPLHCTSASPSPRSSLSLPPPPILCHRILWEGALQVKELIRSRETQNVPQRGFTEVPIYAACMKSAPASSFHCTEGPWVSRGVSGNRPLITSFHSLRGTAVSPSRLVPACKPPNTLFPAASFPTLFDILITQLTILLLRNCHIRNILQKRMAEINQTGLYLQAVKERRAGVTFHF